MSRQGLENGIGQPPDWVKRKMDEFEEAGYVRIKYEPENNSIRYNTGVGNDRHFSKQEDVSVEDFLAMVNGQNEVPWLQGIAEMLHRQRPLWEGALPASEANWKKPKDERSKTIPPPGEVKEALQQIETIGHTIDGFLDDENLTVPQKSRLVALFRAGMRFREYLNISSRMERNPHLNSLPANQRIGIHV